MANELEDQADLAVRLRVALSLCPADALTHRRSDRVSRREKIERHLLAEALVPDEFVDLLAEAVDRTLDAWQVQRENVANFREYLLERDGSRCGSCRVDFSQATDEVDSVRLRDPFKLAWVDPSRHLQATVDHREPVSKFGTNEVDNLWLLCRFCNEGKGDGSPILLKHELDYAADLPWAGSVNPAANLLAHSSRITYRVLARQNFECGRCGGRDHELTVRKERESGLAVLSNLTSVCVECL
ncbi:HNH endonuclease [Kribbella flavida]|uniref:HNH endonuclease n=1 Tax=Kribbella flavida TaxID=182640 RepID=UPI000A06CE98|nr:HNH endonuclease signature motif containing protein [Kribbella flavida]